MKSSFWTKSLIIVGALTLHSHAIFGIGGHWSPALGLELESDSAVINSAANIRLNEKGASGLQGFGIKMWIDALPLVDIQLTGNVQFATYGVDFIMTPPGGTADVTTPLQFDMGPMFPKAKPPFGRMFGDLAILYPFLKIPPLVSLMKIYAGAGASFGVATEVMSAGFAKKAIDKKIASGSGFNPSNAFPSEIAIVLADEIKAAGYKTGAGGFFQIGTQLKPPVVPVAVYMDFKYHFLGFNPSQVGGTAITMELGAAIAF